MSTVDTILGTLGSGRGVAPAATPAVTAAKPQEQTPVPAAATQPQQPPQQPVVQSQLPQQPAVQPQQSSEYKPFIPMDELLKRLGDDPQKTEEELAKEKKKQKRDQIFAAIGDGISALSNLYFTTQGAPNMYTGKNTASERTQIRYDKMQQEYEKKKADYFNGLLKVMDADGKERSWRRTLGLDEQERARYADNIAHRDKREQITDARYDAEKEYRKTRDALTDDWKQKEFDAREKQYGRQNAIAWANHDLSKQSLEDNKELRKLQIETADANTVRGKQLGFADGQGKQVSIYENVWKASMQQVYDAIAEDFKERRDGGDKTAPRALIPTASAADKDNFVKQNWHKSPKASQLMLIFSKLDPATMISKLNESGDDVIDYTPNSGSDDDVIDYVPGKQ